jgi:predicted MPP superfamily phosphohydrolase
MKKEEKEIEEKRVPIIRIILFIILLLIVLIIIYGRFVEPNLLLVNEYNIEDSNLDKTFKTLKIVHLSDLLYGSTTDMKMVDKVIGIVNDKNPDIVIYTGDLLYKEAVLTEDQINELEVKFNSIDTKYGKYYISGDNDKRFESYSTLMENAGFQSLNDDYKILYNKDGASLLISGTKYNSNLKFLDDIEYNGFKMHIMHTPDTMDKIDHLKYNYVFAGHSLNNQINIPFVEKLLLKKGSTTYYSSYYRINDTDLYISNGIGCDNFKFRINSIPSINVYKIKNTSN